MVCVCVGRDRVGSGVYSHAIGGRVHASVFIQVAPRKSVCKDAVLSVMLLLVS